MQTPDRFSAILRFYSSNQACIEARTKQHPLKLIERDELFRILGLDPTVAIKLGQSSATTKDEYDDLYTSGKVSNLSQHSIDLTDSECALISAYRAASPDDRAIIDNIVRRYTHAAEATRLA